jgi:hypothetical protein
LADAAAGCCVSLPEQFSAPRTLYVRFRKAKENMGQCKSNDQGFKSYAYTVFRRGCCCLSASLSTNTLKGTWDSANLRDKTLRGIKGNVGANLSTGTLRKLKRKHGTVSLRKETLKNKKEDFRSKA